MPAAERRDGRMLRVKNTRPLARQTPRLVGAPSTASPAGDLEKKGPKQRLPRSGQLARPTGRHRARANGGRGKPAAEHQPLPRRSGCCWRQLQTPAATGPLPTPSPCHRKRNEARSFGSLLNRMHQTTRRAVRSVKFVGAAIGQGNDHKPIAIGNTRFLPFVDRVTGQRAANPTEFRLDSGRAACRFDEVGY